MCDQTENSSERACSCCKNAEDLVPLLRVGQVAAYLGTTNSYVYALIRYGKLRALNLPVVGKNGEPQTRRMIRIRLSDIEGFLGNAEVINGAD